MTRYAGIEAGGTSWVVAIAEGDPTNIVERADFPTSTPAEVLAAVVAWLKPRKFDCLGIGSFGPVELNKAAAKYGFITTTPKVAWRDADLVGAVKRGLDLPPDFPDIAFDTDVNAPALAEYHLAAEAGAPVGSCAYVTVGTGVGVGLVFNGQMVHGLLHGEGGHISVPPYPGPGGLGAGFATLKTSLGCATWVELETATNSAALATRAGCASPADLKALPDDDPVWDAAAHYLACLCANLILMVSPEKIVLSGGVLLRKCLFPMIRTKVQAYLNGYIDVPAVVTAEGIAKLIVPSEHGNCAGIIGSLYLAKKALAEHKAQKEAKKKAGPGLGSASVQALGALAPFAAGLAAGVLLATAAAKRARA